VASTPQCEDHRSLICMCDAPLPRQVVCPAHVLTKTLLPFGVPVTSLGNAALGCSHCLRQSNMQVRGGSSLQA
jgi:hypothetical protein